MDNKTLGIVLIGVSVVLLVLLGFMRGSVVKAYQIEIDYYISQGIACPSDPNECPHEQRSRAQIPIFIAGALLIGVLSLGVYLLLFDKSHKEIVGALSRQRQVDKKKEVFGILMKGLNPEERIVMKAVREQNGITQQTLRLRADMHKSKLSIVLDGLEKKGLVKREVKGKTKLVWLRVKL